MNRRISTASSGKTKDKKTIIRRKHPKNNTNIPKIKEMRRKNILKRLYNCNIQIRPQKYAEAENHKDLDLRLQRNAKAHLPQSTHARLKLQLTSLLPASAYRTMSSQMRWPTASCVWLSQWASGPVAALLYPASRGHRTTPPAAAPAGPGGEPPCAWLTPLHQSAGGASRNWTPCISKQPPYRHKRKHRCYNQIKIHTCVSKCITQIKKQPFAYLFFSLFLYFSRSSLNAQADNLKLNCGEQDFTAAIISIPTPPANTPDESLPPSPAPIPGILRNTRATAFTHETVKISSL